MLTLEFKISNRECFCISMSHTDKPAFYQLTSYPEDIKLVITCGFLLDKPKRSWKRNIHSLPVVCTPRPPLEGERLSLEHLQNRET